MSKYIIQYYTKSSTISKDKELISLLSQLNAIDEENEEKLKDILSTAIITLIQKKSGLYKHSKNHLIKKIVNKADNKKAKDIISYIKEKEEELLNDKIDNVKFVSDIFNKAKEEKVYIPKTHFLLYVKKIQEEKLIRKIKEDPDEFLNKYKKINFKRIQNFINFLNSSKQIRKIEKKFSLRMDLMDLDFKDKLFEDSQTFLKLTKKNLVKNRKKIIFRILNSEPITNKDIAQWINFDNIIDSINKTENSPEFSQEEIEKIKEEYIKYIRIYFINPMANTINEMLEPNISNIRLVYRVSKDELELFSLIMPYNNELRHLTNVYDGLNKNSIENVIYYSLNEKHYLQFFNFDKNNIDKILNFIDKAKKLKLEEPIKESLITFRDNLINLKNKDKVEKEDLLYIKELYEDLKEKIFLYRDENKKGIMFLFKNEDKKIDELFKIFSNIRNAYKETFFKSTDNIKEIYSKSHIDEIKIEVNSVSKKDEKAYLKFNPDARVFEYYEKENKQPSFSLPVDAVMTKDRNSIKKNITLKYILSYKDRNKNNLSLEVLNYEDVNRLLQKNLYSFKNNLYKEKSNSLTLFNKETIEI